METEQKMIEALKAGDPPAFEAFVKQYQARVYNVCLSLLKQEEDAEDIAQEVFLEVFQKVAGFRGGSEIGTWLYRIAVNKSLEHLRKIKRKRRWARITSLWGEEASLNQPREFAHPGVLMENKERAQILFGKMDQLGEKQRIAFVLHHMEGLPYHEVARVMGISLASVESLIFRAKSNLRKSLEVYYKQSQ